MCGLSSDDELVKVSQQFELSYVSCLPVDNAVDGARFRESISSEHYTLCASHVLLRKTRIGRICCVGCYVIYVGLRIIK